MAEIAQLRVKFVAGTRHALPLPAHLALFQRHEATKRPQERSLTRAVGAHDLQTLAAREPKADAAKHVLLSAPEVQILGDQLAHALMSLRSGRGTPGEYATP